MLLSSNEIIIDDKNYLDFVSNVIVDGQEVTYGLVPRDYNENPIGCYKDVVPWDMDIPVIPRDQWPTLIRQREATKSRLSDIILQGNNGQPIPSLDQGSYGYCWAHSAVGCCEVIRAVANEPYVPLSAFAVACKIKNFRNQGGWGAQACDFIATNGVPTELVWPRKATNRSLDNSKTWEDAAKRKLTEGFMEAGAPYDRDLTLDQVVSLLLRHIPVVVEYNWWGHSVYACDPVDLDSSLPLSHINRWGLRIRNSWTDKWGEKGFGILRGKKAIPDGSVAPRVMSAFNS